MLDKDRQNLIDKVQALLAKADSTTFEPEAKLFKDKATELMTKWAIESHEFKGDSTYVIKTLETESTPTNYEKVNANSVGRFCGVLIVLHTDRVKATQLLKACGTIGNMEAFEYMYESATRQCVSGLLAHIQEFIASGRTPTQKDVNEFNYGFALGLSLKVSELMKSVDKAVTERGLVPINEVDKAENAYMERTNSKLGSTSSVSGQYHQAGVTAGKKANLVKGVNGSSHSHLAIGQ
jgi:hypothetical protein